MTLLDTALELAGWAAAQIATTAPADIDTKAHAADPVTALDRAIERRVAERVLALPGHALVGEEFGRQGPESAEITWYCDPIDGTTNFVAGIGWCCFSLCAHDTSGPLVAVVADPFRREVYGAVRGEGAFAQQLDAAFAVTGPRHPLAVRTTKELAGTVITTEWEAHRAWEGMDAVLQRLSAASCTVRIMGSSALALIQVGAGRAVACLLGHYSPVDDSAAWLVAIEAGAVDRTSADGQFLLAAPGVLAAVEAAWRRR